MIPHKTHYHEASHLVFNAMIQKMNLDYPKPTYVEVKSFGGGSIDGGWLQQVNTLFGEGELNKLTERKKQVIEMFHLLAGYSSYAVFCGNGKKERELDSRFALEKSDFEKCDRIASKITENYEPLDTRINPDNLAILKKIETEVIAVLEMPEVKEAISYVATKIAEQANEHGFSRVEGAEFVGLFDKACEMVEHVNLSDVVDKALEAIGHPTSRE